MDSTVALASTGDRLSGDCHRVDTGLGVLVPVVVLATGFGSKPMLKRRGRLLLGNLFAQCQSTDATRWILHPIGFIR